MSLTGRLAPARFAALPETFHQSVRPTPVPEPYLVDFNGALADELGLDDTDPTDPDLLALLAGNASPARLTPVAAVYAGHQFGVWVPRLGDGRAILLGELTGPDRQPQEIQLKGSGLTRYSRMGDGRAVLRSTIREYLGSEAMHGLGIPTTRALAVVGSDLPVYRERTETAAILARVAPSFVRFGSFEYFASIGNEASLRLLADHVITGHHPALLTLPADERHLAWFRLVVERTAALMADWIAVGWTHGVMNTDNMSILGLTIDYGPYGWMDGYDPNAIPNHTDRDGRYAYGQQPGVGLWNLGRLAEALLPLIPEEPLVEALEQYRPRFAEAMDARMRAKFGLATADDGDPQLMSELLGLMQQQQADYTRSFRALSRWHGDETALAAEFTDAAPLRTWLLRYRERLTREGSVDAERQARMLRTNPKYVLRNWIAQDAIALAETRRYERIGTLRRLLARPFDEHPAHEEFAAAPPPWARELVLSCSS